MFWFCKKDDSDLRKRVERIELKELNAIDEANENVLQVHGQYVRYTPMYIDGMYTSTKSAKYSVRWPHSLDEYEYTIDDIEVLRAVVALHDKGPR